MGEIHDDHCNHLQTDPLPARSGGRRGARLAARNQSQENPMTLAELSLEQIDSLFGLDNALTSELNSTPSTPGGDTEAAA
jgi:hypothetical protein